MDNKLTIHDKYLRMDGIIIYI